MKKFVILGLISVLLFAVTIQEGCGASNLTNSQNTISQTRSATLNILVSELGSGQIPAKLTFLNQDGSVPAVSPLANDPRVATENNIAMTLDGSFQVSLAPGNYQVYASHG